MLFGPFDHLLGAGLVRIRRMLFLILKKPDVSFFGKNIAIGGHCNIESLAKNNFKCILDLRQETQDDEIKIEKFLIEYLNIPVADRTNPDYSQVQISLNWIEQNISKNNNVFIHCNLGRGRAPAMACLYLISKGTPFKDAINQIKKARRYTYFNNEQLNFIKKYATK
jgi:protein-tyrosine phosphatase